MKQSRTCSILNAFTIKPGYGRTIFMGDVAHVMTGSRYQTNSVARGTGVPGALRPKPQDRGVSDAGGARGIRAASLIIQAMLPPGVSIKALFDQSSFVKRSIDSVSGRCWRGAHRIDDCWSWVNGG